ncbi:MAG: ROK family protein, partial [Rhodobacteraceae bacterium]|nr:ROK family protein [Paracoccaceae bacterium]
CGRHGCYETLGAGPGMQHLANMIIGKPVPAPKLAARNDANAQQVLQIWSNIIAELVGVLQLTIDPDCIVLGGGLSNIPGVAKLIHADVVAKGLRGTDVPKIVPAAFGDSSGTRGAALLAIRERAGK